ncbi:DUF2059 domain-containing protein [Salipiger sp. 1_MG-2023]|uniref:DUF2059 domain-containing protein n=1 Tax=Salipiger sp. 1_MG-2023 TaxID=3062665 RepID=UPI0026E3ED05|nr:DUF2059 domain-containing protein [Salipiger sp. 1_MG-2023]MDO6585537.1 DUF2059 domain-containing protein [Salipiger sp. 1_MG-2023]
MSLRLVAPAIVAAFVALPLRADPVDPLNELLDRIGLSEIVQIMRAEGLAYGSEMAADLLPGGANAAWNQAVSMIYDTEVMSAMVRAGFAESFGAADPAPLLAYFGSPEGESVVAMELAARREMIDDAVESAAREAFQGLDGSADPRLGLLDAFVDANDLLESNVVGALNASYEFYLGLADGGAITMSEDEILAEVWSQEPDTRADSREWLYAYLLMAYAPMSDAALGDYVEISSTPEGRAMNRALFAGFNGMYDQISYALGRAAAKQMIAQEL